MTVGKLKQLLNYKPKGLRLSQNDFCYSATCDLSVTRPLPKIIFKTLNLFDVCVYLKDVEKRNIVYVCANGGLANLEAEETYRVYEN